MSSNELHITRANYEEYFLLYVDGELTPAQSDAIEAFAAQHPDLQEELDILLTTKLDAEPVFFNKEALMADSMKHSAIDESLLLYIDDELHGDDRKAVEQKLESDTAYQFQHNLLRQVKLPVEAITYPDKAELYRKEERTVRPITWFRVAAAVFVLLAAGYMWTLTDQVTPATEVARQTTTPPQKPVVTNQPAATTLPSLSTQEPAVVTTTVTPTNEVMASTSKQTASVAPVQQKASMASHTPDTHVEPPVVKTNKVVVPVVIDNSTAAIQPQQIINKNPVTTPTPDTYNSIVAPDKQPAVSEAVAMETDNNKKGGSVKGFLRKATRFIERRTGVSATNEDNELLIGALAINLK